jgi:uncharacterized protein (DUF1810 family)
MKDSDPFDLNRFVATQETSFARALAELKRGRKQSHWMWFIFPQIDGLGSSSIAKFYAIKSLDEAKAYLAHPVLGPRLIECCETLLRVNGKSAAEIMGYPDDLKLRSSMTLFASAADDPELFNKVLEKFFDGHPDPATLKILQD